MQFHVDLKLVAKLAMTVFFLAQGSGYAATAMYVALATIVYFVQVGAFNPILRRLFGENAAVSAREETRRGRTRELRVDPRRTGRAGRETDPAETRVRTARDRAPPPCSPECGTECPRVSWGS